MASNRGSTPSESPFRPARLEQLSQPLPDSITPHSILHVISLLPPDKLFSSRRRRRRRRRWLPRNWPCALPCSVAPAAASTHAPREHSAHFIAPRTLPVRPRALRRGRHAPKSSAPGPARTMSHHPTPRARVPSSKVGADLNPRLYRDRRAISKADVSHEPAFKIAFPFGHTASITLAILSAYLCHTVPSLPLPPRHAVCLLDLTSSSLELFRSSLHCFLPLSLLLRRLDSRSYHLHPSRPSCLLLFAS